jgi:2-polyprenyl-3-methyl-5-hydroxy-6-metoxy-1,4-benzoquinol methylase
MATAEGFAETADIETSSEDYARRFAGAVGEWFLERQASSVRELLASLPHGGRVLDVGGGHAQLVPVLVEAGYEVLVVGSAESCAARLAPWLADHRCRFEVANVTALPYAARSFDAVVSVRLLPHVTAWRELVREICRVAARCAVVDYPSSRSVNAFSEELFAAKKRVEGNTRPFKLFDPQDVRAAFLGEGFRVTQSRPQFLWPMVLHRMLGRAALCRALEAPGRVTGLLRLFGSPVIVRADRFD